MTTVFIIHRNVDICRMKYIEDCKKKLPTLMEVKTFEIIEPEPIKENTKPLICMWSKKIPSKQAIISLYNTHIKLYGRIIDEKLNNVLILEDDAVLTGKPIDKLEDDVWIHFLHDVIYTTHIIRHVSCMANYYPKWENTKKLLNNLIEYKTKKKERHRPIDIELDNMRRIYNLDFRYNYDYFIHPVFEVESTLGNNNYNRKLNKKK